MQRLYFDSALNAGHLHFQMHFRAWNCNSNERCCISLDFRTPDFGYVEVDTCCFLELRNSRIAQNTTIQIIIHIVSEYSNTF